MSPDTSTWLLTTSKAVEPSGRRESTECPRPSVLLAITGERPHVGVATCRGPSWPLHTPVGWGDGTTTPEHGERRVGVIPQKEPYL
jgi:hypothetical protein